MSAASPILPRRLTAAQRAAYVDEFVREYAKAPLSQTEFCARHNLCHNTFHNCMREYTGPRPWLETQHGLGVTRSLQIRKQAAAEAAVEAARGVFWETPVTLMTLLSHVAAKACEDVAYGMARGWVNAQTLTFTAPVLDSREAARLLASTRSGTPKEVKEALFFLLSEDGALCCELINRCVGKECVTPDYLLHRAKRMAEEVEV